MRDNGHVSDMKTVPWQTKSMCVTNKIASDMFRYNMEVKSMKKRVGNFLPLVTHQQAKGLTRLFILITVLFQ